MLDGLEHTRGHGRAAADDRTTSSNHHQVIGGLRYQRHPPITVELDEAWPVHQCRRDPHPVVDLSHLDAACNSGGRSGRELISEAPAIRQESARKTRHLNTDLPLARIRTELRTRRLL